MLQGRQLSISVRAGVTQAGLMHAISFAHRALHMIWVALLLGRGAILMALLACLIVSKLLTGSAHAQESDPIQRGNRLAYDASIKCFVLIGMLVGDAKDDGKADLAATYDQKARRSFDFALQLGEKLGLTGTHVTEDFGLAQTRELPKLVKDKSYFQSSATTCKALGLL